ncbi:rhamnulokinase [Glutamicibacter sp. JL.03c]|uniref:rhamnulokinase n=1 Tax=Glutamicibacter sp. JL.03c TaxID=2984842 RepID=UPI0021F7F18B|nr:rhamnulokinase family protein [Glutamicibacter sp. JL.03c]UYQ77457.1 rhamnulokinase [Glutamicibacter sp. JL.03c]
MSPNQDRHPVAAIDLGATSGRVMIGELVDGKVELTLVHRFANGPVPLAEFDSSASAQALAWDIDELWSQIRAGLAKAFALRPDIASIGVDSWAVDYALLKQGQRLGQVRHYRDPRTELAVPELEQKFSRAELFERNGLQFLAFNTIYQLQAEKQEQRLGSADQLLLVPDYINWLLTGQARCEWTNASTTGLLNQRSGTWDGELVRELGVAGKLAPIIRPGQVVGSLLPGLAQEFGASSSVQVVAVASHDTASAVAATPLAGKSSAYISCGTWGLVGVELAEPVLTPQAQAAGFTNELGLDGSVRFLKNVTGTFLLSESVNHWNQQAAQASEPEVQLAELLSDAAKLPVPQVLIDPQDEVFLAPGRMPVRISEAIKMAGGSAPETRAELIRIVIESLAARFAAQAHEAARLGGFDLEDIHIVGGGSQGELLCQRTADLARVPVAAGPVECTALGNVLVQLRSLPQGANQVEDLRAVVRRSVVLRDYQPVGVLKPA